MFSNFLSANVEKTAWVGTATEMMRESPIRPNVSDKCRLALAPTKDAFQNRVYRENPLSNVKNGPVYPLGK